MATTVERFIAVYQICDNLARMQNNMRVNVKLIQASEAAGKLQVPAKKAFSDLGKAFNERLVANQDILTSFAQQVSAGAGDLGILPQDITDTQSLLVTWATNLQNNAVATKSDTDTLVANVLAAVPAAMLPFGRDISDTAAVVKPA